MRFTRAFIAFALLVAIPARAGAQTLVTEVADGSADAVGSSHTSLALDASGNPHVSYLDATNGNLLYARKSSGVWTSEVADGSANNVGIHSSLVLDASGNAHVSYRDVTTGDLIYAWKSGVVWTRELVDAAGNAGEYSSLALDASGNPHVSYRGGSVSDLKYARKVGGVWTIETADGSANQEGYFTSIALDASGNPHVSYLDITTTDLKYAQKSGGVWTRETVEASSNTVGYFTSIALDASGNPHVSYADFTNDDLKYARKSGGVWTIETADGSANLVGYDTSIALDSFGNTHVSYYDLTNGNLKYTRKSGGAWTIQTMDGSTNIVGDNTSIALDARGSPHVSYRDDTDDNLKYAYFPSQRITSPQPGVTWAVGSVQTIAWAVSGGLPIDNSDIYLSADGGNTFTQIRNEARDFETKIRVPHLPTRFASIKVIRPSPYAEAYMDSFFTIDATVALAKFEAARIADGTGTRLTWETQPGPEAEIRYRVERAADGVAFSTIASGLDRFEYVDPSPSGASHYRLVAINGLGEEYVLGETRATSGMVDDRDLAAFPNPASGPIEISYRVRDARSVDLAIYDASGRRVRTIASGTAALGIQSATWDRRDDSGRDVAAGVYFARLAGAGGFPAMERLTIVR